MVVTSIHWFRMSNISRLMVSSVGRFMMNHVGRLVMRCVDSGRGGTSLV